MTTAEERISKLEGEYPYLATKEDIARLEGKIEANSAEFRAEMRTLYRLMIVGATTLGVLLSAVNVILRLIS